MEKKESQKHLLCAFFWIFIIHDISLVKNGFDNNAPGVLTQTLFMSR